MYEKEKIEYGNYAACSKRFIKLDKPRIYADVNEMVTEVNFEFLQVLSAGIKEHPNDLIILHQCLENFKERGMSRDAMLKNMEELRRESDFGTEDILLDLMDFVSGCCNPAMSIYEEF